MVVKIEKVHVGFKMPKDKHNILVKMGEKIGTGRGVYTEILNEAFNEYVERRMNPEPEKEKIRQALKDIPSLVDDRIDARVREIVREEFQILLRQLSDGKPRH
jgi:hypothetical protein